MAGASADGEVNHWPAFVDVLTTVIMVVTFMLVIMSAAVMVLSQRVVKNLEDQYKAKVAAAAQGAAKGAKPLAAADAGNGAADLGDVVKAAVPINGSEPLSILTRETKDTLAIKVKSIEAAANTKGVEVKTADTLVKIGFEPSAVNYDEENQGKVLAFLKSKAAPGTNYEVWSFVPNNGSISEAQRLAFYRAAVTRNLLIRAGITPTNIVTQIRITDARAADGHMVRVVVKP